MKMYDCPHLTLSFNLVYEVANLLSLTAAQQILKMKISNLKSDIEIQHNADWWRETYLRPHFSP